MCHHPDDAGWAEWLTSELEDYQVPQKIVGHLNRRGERISARLGPVGALALAADDIGPEPHATLAEADFIVAVCSTSAARSSAMGGAIAYFKSIGKSARIIAAIVEGVPGASGDAAEECFNLALRYEVDTSGVVSDRPAEPLAADFRVEGRHPGWFDMDAYAEVLQDLGHASAELIRMLEQQQQRIRLMKLKVVAGMLAINLGELTERDKAYRQEVTRRRVFKVVLSLVVFGLMVASAFRGLGLLSEYRNAAAKAAEAERMARQVSEAAEKLKKEAESRNAQNAAMVRVAEERIKGINHIMGENGLPKDRALALKHLGNADAAGDLGASLWLAKLLVDKTSADAETAMGMERLVRLKDRAPAAEAGEAAYVLAKIYAEGKIVQSDRAKALEFAEISSGKGYVPSMEPFAYMLERGWGGAARVKDSLAWYDRAAAEGSPEGLFSLYLINAQGRPALGVAPDASKASTYLDRAKLAGSPRALYQASLESKNPAEAEDFLERAAKGGDFRSRIALVALYLGGTRGHAIIVERGIFHAGVALDVAIQSSDIGSADEVARILMRSNMVFLCASINPQLRAAADKGSNLSAFVYAMSYGLSQDGNLVRPDIFKAYMLKAAEAGHAEAQYAYGQRVVAGGFADVDPASGAVWVEKATAKGYPQALLLSAKIRREGRLLTKDWGLAASFMKEAASKGLEVDWTSVPRRFRPPDLFPSPALETKPDSTAISPPGAAEMSEAMQIVAGKARRSKESVDQVIKTFPLTASWSESKLGDIGVMLMSVGRYDEGVAYLSRFVLRQDSSAARQAARVLANYFETYKPAQAYQWYLIAQAHFFERKTEIAQERIKLSEAQKEAALISAGVLMAQDAVDAAAESAGLPVRSASFDRKPEGDVAVMAALLRKADALLALSEFPEEAEDAAAIYHQVLNLSPDNFPAMAGLHRSATLLHDEKKAFYWLLRCALTKRPPAETSFSWLVKLAEAYATGTGVRKDQIEAAKWCAQARAELGHAELVSLAAGTAGGGRRELALAKKALEELEQSSSVKRDDPTLALRIKVQKAFNGQVARR